MLFKWQKHTLNDYTLDYFFNNKHLSYVVYAFFSGIDDFHSGFFSLSSSLSPQCVH